MDYSTAPLSRRLFLFGTLAGSAVLARGVFLPGSAAAAVRSAASLGPLINIPQTWNNCGPASIAEVLAYWGISRGQAQVQAVLRPDGVAVGMLPYGVPAYARSLGLQALLGVGGSETLVKRLIAAGIPVIVHQLVSTSDVTGHWRPIEAFDDAQGIFVSSDPYLGAGHQIGYGDFAQMWAARGSTFLLLYPASKQAVVSSTLAAVGWNTHAAYSKDLTQVLHNQLTVIPTGAPAGTETGYRALGLAWDELQLGRSAAARTYLQQAARAGINPIEVHWISAEIR